MLDAQRRLYALADPASKIQDPGSNIFLVFLCCKFTPVCCKNFLKHQPITATIVHGTIFFRIKQATCGISMQTEFTYTKSQLEKAVKQLLEMTGGAKVLAFHGEMGAGKTTLIGALCRELGTKDVTGSPTFSIINQYKSPAGSIYHMDLYRLRDEEEAIQAGVEDLLYSGNLCLVEWPEKAAALLPDDTRHIFISAEDEETRIIKLLHNKF